jgi:hypothetical protein
MVLSQLSPQTVSDLSDDERWRTTQRIVDSAHFRKSPRLSRLLLYLSEQTILEHSELLTEHNIAAKVFEREADFNPGVDTIVRSHMLRLRQKLDQYAGENPSSMRVAVPKGEYLVRFEPVSLPQPHPVSPKSTRLVVTCWLLALAVVLLLAVLVGIVGHSWRRTAAARPSVHPLWSKFFQPHQTTIFVASDSGLVLLHLMTAKDTTLAEYLSRDFHQEVKGLSPERASEVLNVANRRYTSFVTMNILHRLQQLPFVSLGRLEVKHARDIQVDELKQNNAIFVGARGANPWLELYEPAMNFVSSNDVVHHTYSFINRHPKAGEPSSFSVSGTDPAQHVVGVLAFLPNLDGRGNVLIVEGNSMAGAEAVSDFLFDDAVLLPFLADLKKADGTLSHFEVVLESTSVNGNAGPFRILAFRAHP